MEFCIKSYDSVGPIKLGMTKEEIRSLMPEKPWDSHDFRGPYTDYFIASGLFAYYTGEYGVCEAVEFTEPTIAIFENRRINGVPYIEALNWLKKFDDELKVERFLGATSYKFGIGLYAPNYDEEQEPDVHVEAVIVFRRGYYDSIKQTS
ncbi:hypothetical protein QTL97_13490 [Sporosarcina thermotolerans]|uniref:Uncharacterized protein n=1 Tax=Sporosarcina thermotolerans TaxID=633404 RepID=A0AAW9A9V4_9BACL|nr:hypothetical protein [Sporosarcina thermotolerans]MDW0117952.1 hypothetical protein [Sporosarcina thermotolerans]WHT49033.1 hypothetical protein QNH10_04960 [Sporosarcina thermotolerans]